MAAPDPRRVTMPVTMACPVCRSPFPSSGRRTFCTDACRAAAYRRRRAAVRPPLSIPAATHRKPLTVYACDACGARALGEQQCPDCSRFMGRVGLGGACPSCDEPITVRNQLGHSSIVLTSNTYGHVLERRQREVARAMDAVLGG